MSVGAKRCVSGHDIQLRRNPIMQASTPMISHARFGAMRLVQFVPNADIAELESWEFMGHLWVGEAAGFSEWLRLVSEPGVLRSLAIDFTEFPEHSAAEVLRAIELPVQRGMGLAELRELLGEPVKELRFIEDRVTYEFFVPGPPKYEVSCTVLNQGGLTHLVVMAPLPVVRG